MLHHLRQQADKPAERPNLCLADFIAPKDSGVDDWIGGFAVTAGLGIEQHLERFEAGPRRLFVDHPESAGRPPGRGASPNACTASAHEILGLSHPTNTWTTRP